MTEKEIHFVVTYNTDTKEWNVDSGTTEARFPDGNTWNDEAAIWEMTPFNLDVKTRNQLRGLLAEEGS